MVAAWVLVMVDVSGGGGGSSRGHVNIVVSCGGSHGCVAVGLSLTIIICSSSSNCSVVVVVAAVVVFLLVCL